MAGSSQTHARDFAAIGFIVALTVYVLVVGQSLLQPLVIAVVFWFLINVLASLFLDIRLRGIQLYRPLCFLMAILVLVAGLGLIVQFISGSLTDLGDVAVVYEANLKEYWERLPLSENLPAEGFLESVSQWFDITSLLTSIALTFTGLAADSILIIIYTLFLLWEQGNFSSKLTALVGDAAHENSVRKIIDRIRSDIQRYITIKMMTSAATGILSYLILRLLGIDFPEIWGIVIFLLNFIPTVGSIIATLLPATVALAQSTTVGVSLAVTVLVLIGALQVTIGNIIEPRLMGASLNLSPVVILFNLALWGTMWGIVGMFLCVPFLIITTIVLSHFPRTRPIAILLSSNGKIDTQEN
ncbi:MAG: AI-2E family transporter [Pseudohongiella sp.]|nr:AI-2E family transporter [Pseudohongiella sp.]MDO9520027.1 AI-2E family transporter [Pseudohongiella sp.]